MARSIESAATTHPALIMALVELLADTGCKVAVGDSPGMGSAAGVVNKLGLAGEFRRYGVQIAELQTPALFNPARSAVFERRFKHLQLAAELNGYDRIINLPKFKSHGQMGVTLATKNLFGCVPGHNKAGWHFTIGKDSRDFARLLVEIALTVQATLHILDGITGMDGNGPSNGRPRPLNVLIAGANPLAVDRVAVELIAKRWQQFPIFEAAQALKFPGVDLAEISVVGDSLQTLQIDDFQTPAFHDLTLMLKNRALSKLAARLLKQRLIIDPGRCTLCRRCEAQCPAKAIRFQGGIRIDEKLCIRCCCCQEMCPAGALSIHTPVTVKILHRFKWM